MLKIMNILVGMRIEYKHSHIKATAIKYIYYIYNEYDITTIISHIFAFLLKK